MTSRDDPRNQREAATDLVQKQVLGLAVEDVERE